MLCVSWGINLVSLSTLYRPLQNFNYLYFSVEIKAFYQRHAFRRKLGCWSHYSWKEVIWGILFAWGRQAQQGFWEQREHLAARAPDVREGLGLCPLPVGAGQPLRQKQSSISSSVCEGTRRENWFMASKGPNKVLEGSLNAIECTVDKIFLAEKLTAANSPLIHTGFWEVPPSLVHKSNK